MWACLRSARRLTLATWIPAVVTLVALPSGFLEVDVAALFSVCGLYGVLPAVVAWLLDISASPPVPAA